VVALALAPASPLSGGSGGNSTPTAGPLSLLPSTSPSPEHASRSRWLQGCRRRGSLPSPISSWRPSQSFIVVAANSSRGCFGGAPARSGCTVSRFGCPMAGSGWPALGQPWAGATLALGLDFGGLIDIWPGVAASVRLGPTAASCVDPPAACVKFPVAYALPSRIRSVAGCRAHGGMG